MIVLLKNEKLPTSASAGGRETTQPRQEENQTAQPCGQIYGKWITHCCVKQSWLLIKQQRAHQKPCGMDRISGILPSLDTHSVGGL